jgi:hypothetical protein
MRISSWLKFRPQGPRFGNHDRAADFLVGVATSVEFNLLDIGSRRPKMKIIAGSAK